MKICRSMYLYVLIGLILLVGVCLFVNHAEGAISYTPSSGALASSTSLNNSFIEQLYAADKAGALALRTATKTANESAPVAHTYKFEPADYLMLGGSNNDFYVTLSGWDATLVNLTVRIYGTNWYGVNQSEDLYFTGNSVVYATLLYRTSNSSMVFKCWKTGAFSVSVVVSQGQWGRMWKTGTNSYRIVNCTPALSGYYNQTNTSISFYPAAGTLINFGTAGHCIFGNLSSTGVARWGCHFINEKNVNATLSATAAVTYMKFYACSFMSYPFNRSSSALRISQTLGKLDIRNCVFSQNAYIVSGGTNSIFKRNTMVSAVGGIANILGTTALVDDQFFANVSIPISMGTSACTMYNCSVAGYDYIFKWTPIGLTPIKHHLRNFKVSGDMKCQYLGTATGFVEVRFQYGLSIRVRNGTANLSGASVNYYEINASSLVRKRVHSLTSDANGLCGYKYLNRSIWLKGNVYPGSNYTVMVWINKSGYQSVKMNFTMSREMIFDVVLLKNYTSGLVVTENIVDATGTHEYAWYPNLGLHGEWWVWANYTGNPGTGSSGLLVDNPNPANGTFLTNFLQARSTGLTTSVDVSGNTNFTELTEANLGTGKPYENSTTGVTTKSLGAYGQSFTPITNFVLHNISIKVNSMVGGSLFFSVTNVDNNGSPSDVLSTGVWIVDNLVASWMNVSMSPVSLVSGKQYAFTITTDDPGTNDWYYKFSTDPYAGGCRLDGSGVSWNKRINDDFTFKMWGWSFGGNISWSETLNQTWSSNSSGAWVPYAHMIAVSNSTYSVLNTNFSHNNTRYWWRVATSNSSGTVLDNQTWTFTTAQRKQIIPISTSDHLSMGVMVGCMFGGLGVLLVGRRRRKDSLHGGRV